MLKKYTKGIVFLSLLSLSVSSFADNRGDYNYPERNIDTDDASQPKSSRQAMDQMQDRNITPDAGPRVAHGADVFITADFIYWSVREDGLAYAVTGNSNSQAVPAGRGSVRHVDFDWEPGFKVGLGVNLSHDGWDLFAEYTWLRSHPSKSTTRRDFSDDANRIVPVWFVGGLGEGMGDITYTSASGEWDFHFNVIDLELGRNFYISKYLTIRPHIGLKGTWQDEDLKVKYGGILTVENDLIDEWDVSSRMKQDLDYWGVGIRAGIDNAWYFMRNFCLFGDLALTALWGRYDTDRKDWVTEPIDPDLDPEVVTTNRMNFDNEFHSIKGILELTIGLRYDIWWDDDDYHFGFSAGWEEQIWLNHNQFFNLRQEASYGDLVLHGLTLKARFDF